MSNALIIVDVQLDFCEDGEGTLAVKDTSSMIEIINKIRTSNIFKCIFLSCDWHPINHVSFASSHVNGVPFTSVILPVSSADSLLAKSFSSSSSLPSLDLWPTHCVQHSRGAAFHPKLLRNENDVIICKGTCSEIECYSAFGCGSEDTHLENILKENDIENIFVTGMCTDYCVFHTAMDAVLRGFNTYVVEDACRYVNKQNARNKINMLKEKGAHIINSNFFFSGNRPNCSQRAP